MYPEYGNDNPDHMIAGSLSFIPQQYLCIKDVDYYNTGLQIALECTVIASVGPIYLR
jgi:hypothetical protein